MPRLRSRAQLTEASKPPPQAMSNRPRRNISSQQRIRDASPQSSTTITVARDPSSSPADARGSIRLTLKMPPNKLREATSGVRGRPPTTNLRDSFEPAETVNGPRSSRAKRSVIIDSGSEDEDDDDEENEDEDAEGDEEDAQGEEDEEVGDEEGDEEEDEEEEVEEEEDAEGDEDEDEDAEGESDVDMDDADPPPPPIIQRTGPPEKPRLLVTPAPTKGQVKSVEAREVQMANGGVSDEDLSELPEDEDAEGEEIAEDEAMVDADDDAEGDSDEDLSRDGTPDVTKMTKRQRGRIGNTSDELFMSLNMEPQTKLHLTDEQRALRRAEMARRRKNLSEKRNEEEKMDTINRLLKKQAPKRRGKISAAEIAAGAETPEVLPGSQDETERAEPDFIRWVSNREGCRIGVPVEWKGKAVTGVLGNGNNSWRMVEEVEG